MINKLLRLLGYYLACKEKGHVPIVGGFKCIYCKKFKILKPRD